VRDAAFRAVIDASGTYRTPNSLASSGLDPLGLDDVAEFVTHALPDVLGDDRTRFAGKHTTVVGAGHSAANTLLNLATLTETEPGTASPGLSATAARRACRARPPTSWRHAPDWVPGGRARGVGVIDVVDRFEIVRLSRRDDGVRIIASRAGELVELDTDVIVNATGFRPNLDMLREVRLELDDIVEAPKRLAPLIDPNVHSCGTVEPHGFAELKQPEDGFLPRRHEELRPRTDVPPRDRVRAGAVDRRVARRGCRIRRAGAAHAARDGRVLHGSRSDGRRLLLVTGPSS
jgi:hypothetical protein